MTQLESARFGAWFDRLQSMVDQALGRVGHRPVVATVADDLARLFGADAVLVVVSFAASEPVRTGRFVGASVALDASWPPADVVEVTRELAAPRMLDRDTIEMIFATSDAPRIDSAA